MKDRVFSTTYKSNLTLPYIVVPLILGAILGLIGIYLDRLIFTLSSAIFTSFAVWHWPFLDSSKPVLKLTSQGADIDGIGRIPWSAIKQVELVEKRKKNQTPSENCGLRIILNSPLSSAIQPLKLMDRPKWQKPLTKEIDPYTLHIEAGWLFDSQIDIANAFAWFLTPHKK